MNDVEQKIAAALGFCARVVIYSLTAVWTAWSVVAVVLAISLLCSLFSSEAKGADAFAPYRAVADIQYDGGPGRTWQGSGTLIATAGDDWGLVLTCRHVCPRVGAPVNLRWRWAGQQETTGRVLYVQAGDSYANDLALVLAGRPKGVTPRKVVRVEPGGGPWVGAGYRGGRLRHFRANWYKLTDSGIHTFQGAAVGGMSGGPLFNSRGEVVGVVVASDRNTKSISADGEWLHQMIARYRR